MKTIEINIVVFEDAEAWLKENLADFWVNGIAAVYPIDKNFTPELGRHYYDEEEDATKFVDFHGHVEALELLCSMVGKTLFVGGITSPIDLVDPCNWDVEVVDAYFQLVYHGEVIYG